MEESIFFLFIDVIICSLVGLVGRNRKIGFVWSFIFSLLLSPFIGIFIVLFSKKRDLIFVDGTKNHIPPTEES